MGDWQTKRRQRQIKVSNLGNADLELLVAIHEIVEQHLCEKFGVTEQEVDKYDEEYNGTYSEPGNDPTSPYQFQHQAAMEIEEHLARLLGVDWRHYEAVIDRL